MMERRRIADEVAKRIASEHKIPVIESPGSAYYIITLDIEGEVPTPAELAQLVSYREFVVRDYYTEAWQQRILSMDLPADGGHNTTAFRKGSPWLDEYPAAAGSWFYEKVTWTMHGKVPNIAARDFVPLTLVQVMDRIQQWDKEPRKNWLAWKTTHADVFPGEGK